MFRNYFKVNSICLTPTGGIRKYQLFFTILYYLKWQWTVDSKAGAASGGGIYCLIYFDNSLQQVNQCLNRVNTHEICESIEDSHEDRLP